MSLLKVSPDELVYVCACGAENNIPMSKVVLIGDAVSLPMCEECNDCASSIIPPHYSDGWEELDDMTIKRQVMAQYAHYFAVKSGQSKVRQDYRDGKWEDVESKESIFQRISEQGRYDFVDAAITKLEADVHPLKRKVWKNFKETGKPTPKVKRHLLDATKSPSFRRSIKGAVVGGELDRSELVKPIPEPKYPPEYEKREKPEKPEKEPK